MEDKVERSIMDKEVKRVKQAGEEAEKRAIKKGNRKALKCGIWGLIIGAIIWWIVGFAFFGWTTGGTAREMADAAVIEQMAKICVAQFNQDPEKDKNFEELKAESSWSRKDYVQKGDWATMPGDKEPPYLYEVSDKCAELLVPE